MFGEGLRFQGSGQGCRVSVRCFGLVARHEPRYSVRNSLGITSDKI